MGSCQASPQCFTVSVSNHIQSIMSAFLLGQRWVNGVGIWEEHMAGEIGRHLATKANKTSGKG